MSSKIIITAAGPNMEPILKNFSLPSFEKYADTFGYDIHAEMLSNDSLQRKSSSAKEARWQKIRLIERYIRTYDTVLWLDADTIIRRFDSDIADSLGANSFQGLVLHSVPAEQRINPNTGVWIIRQHPLTRKFLGRVNSIGMPDGRWADQGAVMRALGWELGDDRYFGACPPTDQNKYVRHTTWLPIGWNQPYMDNRPNPEAYAGRPIDSDPYVIHFMAMTIEDRLKYMPLQTEKMASLRN